MSFKGKTFTFLLSMLAGCNAVFAGGFQVNLQGQKATGMGHTGTGSARDASALLFNPGALAFMDSVNSIIFGSSFIIPKIAYREPWPGDYTAQNELHVGTPFSLYAAFKLKPQHHFMLGLAVYTPFGSRSEWPSDWKGQFLIREINLKTIFIQPTISYRIDDKMGVGLGVIYATGGFGLRKGVPVQDSSGNYGEGTLDGAARGFGMNVGFFYRLTPSLTAGINLRSAVKVEVKNGSASFEVPSSLEEYFPATTFRTSLTLPPVVTAGFGWRADSAWSFAADMNYVAWRTYDSLRIDFEENTDKLKDISSARMYHNSYIFRVGAEWKIKNGHALRMGAYYDMTPVPDGYLTPETPDADKTGITCGATIKMGQKVNLDLSFLYIEGQERTDTNIETQFGGTFKSRAFVPGFGLEVKW
ncbi:MAG: outer membrane protein transport protein [Bacteroidia bacterium]|nr:outer membrane protein transport protein [Bacteroidia bacterium]